MFRKRKTNNRSEDQQYVESIRSWIADLPQSQPNQTSRVLVDAVEQILFTSVDSKTRFDMLELLRSPIGCVINSLTNQITNQNDTIATGNKITSTRIRQLYMRYALAYKTVAEQPSEKCSSTDKAVLIHRAVYRAMDSLSELLRDNSLLYSPDPPEAWNEIHSLYKHAVQAGIQLQPGFEEAQTLRQHTTIEHLYKRVLLYAISNPYQFSAKENREIYESISHWARYCKLQRLHPRLLRDSATAIVHLDRDQGPNIFCRHIEVEETSLIFDTTDLVKRLEFWINYADANPNQEVLYGLDAGTARRLINSWSIDSTRRQSEKREHRNTPVCIGLGIEGIHGLAMWDKLDNSTNNNSGVLQVFYYARNGKDHRRDNRGAPIRTGNVHQSSEDNSASLESTSSEAPHPLSPAAEKKLPTLSSLPVVLMNADEYGFCLLYRGKNTREIKVGQLIGIVAQDENMPPFSLTVIRWKKHVADHVLMGLETFRHNANPSYALRRCIQTGKIKSQRVLLLPGCPDSSPKSSVLMPPDFSEGETVTLETERGEMETTLARRLHVDEIFAWFELAQPTVETHVA